MEWVPWSTCWNPGHGFPTVDFFDGAPIKLFETMGDADAYAVQFDQESQPHGIQFMLDPKGKVVTAGKKKKKSPRAV